MYLSVFNLSGRRKTINGQRAFSDETDAGVHVRTHTRVRAARRENATVDARCSAGDRMKCAIILCSF